MLFEQDHHVITGRVPPGTGTQIWRADSDTAALLPSHRDWMPVHAQAAVAFLTGRLTHMDIRPGISFVMRRSRLILLWPLLSLCIAGLGWSSILDSLERERRALEEDALRDAATIARGYAGHLARTFHMIDQILQHVRFEWALSDQRLRLEGHSAPGLFPSTPIFNVGIVGPDGKLITNTLPVRAEDVSDRMYYRFHATQVADTLYVGEAAKGRSTGRSVVHFSRRLAGGDGAFAGVVRAAVAPAYLTANYDRVTLGGNGLLSILGSDGAIRASRVGETTYASYTSPFAGAPGAAALRDALLARPGGSMLVDGARWFGDRRNRYLGWQQVPGFPVVAIAGLDEQEAFAAFAKFRANTLTRTIISSAVLAIFTLIAMALSVRLGWRQYQVELAREAYRLATEEGTEGFYICRAIRDRNGGIADFEVVDCNQTGAELYGRPRQALIGARLSKLHQADDSDWHARLRHRFIIALERGVFEDEIEVPLQDGREKWYRLKMAHSKGLLSVTAWDITESKQHMFELERRGNEDLLTGLPNRHWMTAYLPAALQRAGDRNGTVALLFVDLDGFKNVNDTAGHLRGDELLRNVAKRLRLAVRPTDHVVRVGGDEFVVVVEQVQDRAAVAQVAERVLQAFQERFRIAECSYPVGASIGISLFPEDGADMQELLTHADAAMYAVKTSGKMNYRFFDRDYYESIRAKIDRNAELRHALDADQLILYYQPRVEVATGETCSLEALVRWAHPARGILEPIDFIPLAEETGLIVQLGEVVIDKVCAQIAQWSEQGRHVVPVSINVSPRQFNESDVTDVLRKALLRHGVAPRLVEIELTESSMTADSAHVSRALETMQQLGIALAVDDFGTGYSSLSQLQRLDFDVLKVDKAFTAELEKTREGSVFFTAIITMAHALGMRVVAEGVETAGQARRLKQLDCDELQGYFISMPLPATATQPVLARCVW
ncbi:bifunctional diguanylate cyclase/phosphodiesterase [Pseudoduganella umbonata]|uniref:Diguanylate cyclase (GGDEF)-like protein n=1 Tax=Pseudoduganella umbonata TaxID=864828 RepID=A0A7W5HBS5_9BURK|nr:EAL domain-containing protein [Pseudoduganella umbonata]MBB3221277.1 diguanylate cyclase (GGDEF)-like protein [Pseudoduganella umbonata]